MSMIGSSPKIVLKLGCESRNSNDPVKVMMPPEGVMERTRSIFAVGEVREKVRWYDRLNRYGRYISDSITSVDNKFTKLIRFHTGENIVR